MDNNENLEAPLLDAAKEQDIVVPTPQASAAPVEAEVIPSSEEEYNPHSIPRGHFCDDLCDCCGSVGCCHSSCLMACCCPLSKFKFKCMIEY